MQVITPTIGRKVWYWPSGVSTINDAQITNLDSNQPMDATIVFVWGDRLVSLAVLDHAGVLHSAGSVPLKQPDDITPRYAFCEWMPFQVGQAKPAPAAPKNYTWDDVASHEVARAHMNDTLDYFILMKDGRHFKGNVKPALNYSAWMNLAIADINRQAAT